MAKQSGATVSVDTSQFEALSEAILNSARDISIANHPLGVGGHQLTTDQRLNAARAAAFKAIVKDRRKQIQTLMTRGAPGTRLKRHTAYRVGTKAVKKGGMPFVKAGIPQKYDKQGNLKVPKGRSLAKEVGAFSGFVHYGTGQRETKSGANRGRIEANKWMYKKQPIATKLFERSYAKHGEKVLTEYWERAAKRVAGRLERTGHAEAFTTGDDFRRTYHK